MSRNLKYFLIPILVGLPVWWGTGALEKDLGYFFYGWELAHNPVFLTAEAGQRSLERQIRESKPFRNKNIADLEIEAKSAISILADDKGGERILLEKEKNAELPMASLTKLMTAKIVLDNYDPSREVTISKEAVAQEENLGQLSAGLTLPVKYLLYPLLMESSNDAAFALANDYDGITEKEFVRLMNKKAVELSLPNTKFFNSTGLDIEKPKELANYSSSLDLAKFAESLLKDYLLWQILSTEKFNNYGPELTNINKLLRKFPGTIGGKTGYTEKALGTFVLVMEAPSGKGHIINVILGSENKFLEMEKLINWLNSAYSW